MKNRLYLVCGVLVFAAVLGLLWWSPWEPREPAYDGKPISYLLAPVSPLGPQATTSHNPPPSLLSDASAVPFLVRALKRDSWIGAAVYRKWLWPKLPRSMQRHLPLPAVDNYVARCGAAWYLGHMETLAKPSIPALIGALNEDEDSSVRAQAAWALGVLGNGNKSAVAALAAARNDKDYIVRFSVTSALLKIDPEAAAKVGVKKPSR